MSQCSIVIAACYLELRQPDQRIFDSRRIRIVHHDAPVIHFRICRGCSQNGAPVYTLRVIVRSGLGNRNHRIHQCSARGGIAVVHHCLRSPIHRIHCRRRLRRYQ